LEVQREESGPLKLGVTWVEKQENDQKPKISGQTGFFEPETDWISQINNPGKNTKGKTLRRIIWLPARNTGGNYQLVLSNKSSSKPVRINRLEIFSLQPQTLENNQAHLAGLPAPATPNFLGNLQSVQRKKVGRYLDVSGFFENFQAQKTFSIQAGSKVNSWETMYLGTVRLMDYMHRSGTSNIWIPVRTQGGSLYPSAYSPTSPRSDDSIFNNQSHQTDRLDTLGLLLKSFHTRNLGLSPVVDFSGTSQAAEQLIAGGASLRLQVPSLSPQPSGQHYNPINPDYQTTVLQTIREIGKKYGNHRSFSSLAIRLSPESNLLLPSEEYPLDLASFQSFLRDTGTQWTGKRPVDSARVEERYQWVMTNQRAKWNQWRTDRLFDFYQRIEKVFDEAVIQSGRTTGKIPVYFVFDRWQDKDQFLAAGSGQLTKQFDWKHQMERIGLDIEKFRQKDAPGFLLSWRMPPSESFAERNKGKSTQRDQGLWDELRGIRKFGIVSGVRSEMQQITSASGSFPNEKKKPWESVFVGNRPSV